MNKFISQLFFVGGLVGFLIFVPQSILAAELYFKTYTNNDFIEVRIDPQSKTLNVVEGEIKFSGPASSDLLVQVENGQSILPIWPIAPHYDADKKSIIFTGGMPNGFDNEGLLFRLRLSPTYSGKLDISYEGVAYLNDGKGTMEDVSSENFEISVGKNMESKPQRETFDFIKYKYVKIILFIVAVLIFIYKYGFKKNQTQ